MPKVMNRNCLFGEGAIWLASPKVFVREATGLVREWSTLDGLMYNILAITIPTAFALIFSLVPFVFLGADVVTATIFGMIVFLPVGVTYAMMAVTMPRSGGDYVFQKRPDNRAQVLCADRSLAKAQDERPLLVIWICSRSAA